MSELNVPPGTLMQGDNLEFLRGINSESVDLIATDPPFNKGRDFHATPDSLAAGASFHDRWSWDDDVEQDWIDEIQDDWPAVWAVIDWSRLTYGDDMGAFLCYMGVRLLEMRRVLKPTGSLYLHCDDTAGAYLKTLLDAVFGHDNFRNEIIWCYKASNSPIKNSFNRKSDKILFYAKGRHNTFNPLFTPYSEQYLEQSYKHIDENGRRYRKHSKRKDGSERRLYLEEAKGVPVLNWWADIQGFGTATQSAERTGYPTQKPAALYKRIIAASSNEGDVVLDPFCGCATTLIAAQQLDRRWLGIDIWPTSIDLVRARLTEECPLFTGKVRAIAKPPKRTDDGGVAAPPLRSKKVTAAVAPKGELMPRAEMIERLVDEQGGKCAGCDRAYDDPLIWELDHKLPRSEGGHNGISNRALLCPPCNRIKGNKLTLTGLRSENQKLKRMG